MLYHNYIFLSTNYFLQEKKQNKNEFIKILKGNIDVVVETYSTVGLKPNTTILLWLQSDYLEANQNLLNKLMHSQMGKYFVITHTIFGIKRPSQYAKGQEEATIRKGGKYMTIYPFTKTQDWYKLSFSKRNELMKGHIAIGRKYPQITQLLLYSYGVDDCDFIVSYETDNLFEFQTLVMELRSDKVRDFTLKDTPIFTCIYKTPQEIIEFL